MMYLTNTAISNRHLNGTWRSLKAKNWQLLFVKTFWNMGDNPLYRITPMEQLAPHKPDVMINLSASPYNYAQDIVRNSIVKAHTVNITFPCCIVIP